MLGLRRALGSGLDVPSPGASRAGRRAGAAWGLIGLCPAAWRTRPPSACVARCAAQRRPSQQRRPVQHRSDPTPSPAVPPSPDRRCTPWVNDQPAIPLARLNSNSICQRHRYASHTSRAASTPAGTFVANARPVARRQLRRAGFPAVLAFLRSRSFCRRRSATSCGQRRATNRQGVPTDSINSPRHVYHVALQPAQPLGQFQPLAALLPDASAYRDAGLSRSRRRTTGPDAPHRRSPCRPDTERLQAGHGGGRLVRRRWCGLGGRTGPGACRPSVRSGAGS